MRPSSRSLFRLAEGVATRPVAFETTPAGARVYISDYTAGAGDDLSQWQLVGEAPVNIDHDPDLGLLPRSGDQRRGSRQRMWSSVAPTSCD